MKISANWAAGGALAVSGALMVGGWLLLASPSVLGSGQGWDAVVVGLIFGTMYGQMSLAAAWFALGPLSFAWRVFLTMGLLGAISLTVGLAISYGMEEAVAIAAPVGTMLFGQWFVTQLPFWGLVATFGVQVCRRPTGFSERTPPGKEFGYREVMILTVSCAACFGIFWLVFATRGWRIRESALDALLAIGFLAAVDSIIMFPVSVALLLERKAPLATVIAIGFAVFVAAIEIPVIRCFPFGLSDPAMLWSIHAFRGAWVVGILLILRAGGYRLVRLAFMPPGNLCQSAKVPLVPSR